MVCIKVCLERVLKVIYLISHIMVVANGQQRACVEDPLAIASGLYGLYMESQYGNFSLATINCFREEFTSVDIKRYIRDHTMNRNCGNPGVDSCDLPETSGIVAASSGVFERAQCSWDYMIDLNENRIPQRLAKAVCRCRHCHRGTCKPIGSFVPVLRRQCSQITGRYEYLKSLEEVPVGCACVLGRRAGNEWQNTLRMQS